jgi:glutathione synthase/RimK-type ligase-like ATP-grasp enzyme
MICIIGSAQHSQVLAVLAALSERRAEVVSIDHASASALTVSVEQRHAGLRFMVGGTELPEGLVTWAAGKYLRQNFGHTEEWANAFIAGANWRETANNILRTLPGEVVNAPDSVARAGSKLWQCRLALDVGFRVPDSLVTNESDQIRLWAGQGELVIKAIGDPHMPRVVPEVGQAVMMTSDLTPDMLSHREAREPHPVYVQRKVAKKAEHRVVVVAHRVFAFGIDPKQHPIMHTDYRYGGEMVDYMPEELPPDIVAKILELHSRAGLFTGCYDLIETPDGDFVFLEVNPDGIWGKHDEIIGGAISAAFADELIHRESLCRARKEPVAGDAMGRCGSRPDACALPA